VAVDVLIRESSWLAFDVAISTSSFGLFYCMVWNLQHFVLIVKDCKSMFLGEFLQLMLFQWIVDLVVSSEWILWSPKTCLAMVFAGGPFLCCLCSAIFKLYQAVDVQKGRRPIWSLMYSYFFRDCFVSFCLCFP
jgi:hypothetical protein